MILWEVLIIVIFSILHNSNKAEKCEVSAADWVKGCLIFRGFFLFFYIALLVYAAFKDSMSYLIFTLLFIAQTIYMFWLIKGDIMFFDTMYKCSGDLKATMKYLVFAGFADMCVWLIMFFI